MARQNSWIDLASEVRRCSVGSHETVNDFETADLTPLVSPALPISSVLVSDQSEFEFSRPSVSGGDTDQPIEQMPPYRGVPSLLTSLVFHLSLILILALVSVGNGGKKLVQLFATTSESVEIEELVSIEMVLDTPIVETELVLDTNS